MRFLYGTIDGDQTITEMLTKSKRVIVVVYCFYPSKELMDVLLKLQDLTLIYSREYETTDPHSLWRLHRKKNSKILFAPKNHENGRLHEKIYYAVQEDNTEWSLVCSANMTGKGFNENQEAGILLNSTDMGDVSILQDIRQYLNQLINTYGKNEFHLGEYQYGKQQRQLMQRVRKELRKKAKKESRKWDEIRYWTIKTGSRQAKEYFEKQFIKYSLIGHGHGIADSLGSKKFPEIKKNDLVVICTGYNNSNTNPVNIYGIGRVKHNKYKTYQINSRDFISNNVEDLQFKGWLHYWYYIDELLKLRTPIHISRDQLSNIFGRETLQRTCHEISAKGFYNLVEYLNEHFGTNLELPA